MTRLYVPTLSDCGTVVVEGPEAHHWSHVLRGTAGDPVELFNGNGRVARAVVTKIHKRGLELQLQEVRNEPRPPDELTLATAVPKGDRFDWLIEKATELGVTRLIPLVTSRSIVDPRDSKLEKLRNTVVAACKQSRRNHLLEITSVTGWDEFLRSHSGPQVLLAHPIPGGPPLSGIDWSSPSLTCVIGPEGGFAESEVAAALARGFQSIQLGPQILRIETAGLFLASLALAGRGRGTLSE